MIFYIDDLNIAIECQGLQHFKPISFSSNSSKDFIEKQYNKLLTLDRNKKKICDEHDLYIIYVVETKIYNYLKTIDLSHINYDFYCIDDLKNIIKNILLKKRETHKLSDKNEV